MDVKYELQKLKSGYGFVAGCDEVGRGCLAGPVVAAAVAFAPGNLKLHVKTLKEVKDSKLLSPQKRGELDGIIKSHALAWGIGIVPPETIDKVNIHRASLLAMRRAVEKMMKGVSCENKKMILALDGKFTIPKFDPHTRTGKTGLVCGFDMQQEAVVDGDNKIISIAAASIIAKVYRDNLMEKLHVKYPDYDFARHKGYATKHHRSMISKFGLTVIHRRSFCNSFL